MKSLKWKNKKELKKEIVVLLKNKELRKNWSKLKIALLKIQILEKNIDKVLDRAEKVKFKSSRYKIEEPEKGYYEVELNWEDLENMNFWNVMLKRKMDWL